MIPAPVVRHLVAPLLTAALKLAAALGVVAALALLVAAAPFSAVASIVAREDG